MYFCQQVERVTRTNRDYGGAALQPGYKVTYWRVEDRNGIPTWYLHGESMTYWVEDIYGEDDVRRDARRAGKFRREGVPFMAVSPGPVTMAQAAKLTGCLPPASLDYLREHIDMKRDYVSNYQKPKKERPKKAMPTIAQIHRKEEKRAEEMANAYRRESERLARRAAQWERRRTRARKAAEKHEATESTPNPVEN